MFALHYKPIQPALPCKADLDSDHVCDALFGDNVHLIVAAKGAQEMLDAVDYDTLCTDRFVFASLTPKRDVHGHFKAIISINTLPRGAQSNEHGALEVTFTLLEGRLERHGVLQTRAQFPVNLLVSSVLRSDLRTTVRFDCSSGSVVEDNPLVVLPRSACHARSVVTRGRRAHHTPYVNYDKPPPSMVEFKTNLWDVFEDGDIALPKRS